MTAKKKTKAQPKKVVGYPYMVKVLHFDKNEKPSDISTVYCRNKEEAEKQVSLVRRLAGKNSLTAKNTHILKKNK